MAKSKSTSALPSILINRCSTGDTLNYCAAVLRYIAESRDPEEPSSEDYVFGRHLVLMSVVEALRCLESRETGGHG